MTKNIEIHGDRIVTRDHEGFPMNREIAPDNTEKMAMMTDDNDNLIEITDDNGDPIEKTAENGYNVEIAEDEWTEDKYTEEWTKTPGGFCRIDIDLDDNIRKDLIDFWARDNLNEASLETYEELLAKGSQEDALYGAVLNDIIIQTLTEQIARTEAENDKPDA